MFHVGWFPCEFSWWLENAPHCPFVERSLTNMKLNIANPHTGMQKVIECDDELKLRAFYEKRMTQEVDGEHLGEEFKGFVFKISGGNDKQGFPMKQGVLTNGRARLLLSKGKSCYRPRRKGERKRKSVRGCIVGPDLSVLNLVVVKAGDSEVAGLTDGHIPRRLGPKRASNIRKLFNLSKEDDVRKYVIRRKFDSKTGKKNDKAPKIQRLVTPRTLHHKAQIAAKKLQQREKVKRDAAEYSRLYTQRVKEQKERRASEIAKRRSSRKASEVKAAAAPRSKCAGVFSSWLASWTRRPNQLYKLQLTMVTNDFVESSLFHRCLLHVN
ncbi:hypothetical protein Ae201684P_002124 [Aphanomyces euteiches]|nr:hypothetical protein Ae201684P_002124 [Aphanomyces euteiches]